MKEKVLVTGGTGFIGRNVVDELIKRGYEVHSLVYPPFAPEKDGLVQYKMNLLDKESLEEFFKNHSFENLIHLAWYVSSKIIPLKTSFTSPGMSDLNATSTT